MYELGNFQFIIFDSTVQRPALFQNGVTTIDVLVRYMFSSL